MTRPEVVVVSGSYGAGHDAAADALTLQLEAAGRSVRRLDVAEELPWRLGVMLRWLYLLQLRLAPATWGGTLRGLERDGLLTRGVRRLLGLLGGHLVREVAGAELVVSTHPFASQVLGEARSRGVLEVPVVTYLTDASVHRLWVHPEVDLHLAIHEVAATQARELGGRSAVVRPVVLPAAPAAGAEWEPPWSTNLPVALVVGGSQGIGELRAGALDLVATGLVTPVVACGTNERLRRRLGRDAGVVALGWRDDLPALVSAAAVVVQNAGGMTSLESLAAGRPLLTYRAIAGHGRTNADALARAGLVPWAHDETELPGLLADLLAAGKAPGLPDDAPSPAAVLEAHGLLAPALVAA